MRRQVKPFVTEYRGSARRSKDHPASSELQQDSQAPRSRSYAAAEKLFQSEPSDESYEAALRAADALFDASPRPAAPAPGSSGASAPETRRISPASAPFRTPSDEVAREVFAEEDEGAAGGLLGRDAAVPPRRILQAIEPPTEDRFAALEAERAPKRRGRKPGSKNKPKLVSSDDWGASRPASATVPALTAAVAPAARVPTLEAVSLFHEEETDEVVDVLGGDEGNAMPQPRGRNDKFGWKRAGLRPGERWKRRLPKSAW